MAKYKYVSVSSIYYTSGDAEQLIIYLNNGYNIINTAVVGENVQYILKLEEEAKIF